ncbi:hypothetical protein GXW74_05580 [Roseomonas eburnea]|uniref:HdeD family acid-resistance protein n=1 Tax=Neoroseomonas eburnea TaxID=1346889 RepID=A0A9X9X8B3_9PROT|nr:DUF308 domain-containing protein [Neoroseomonas eburnea]MBR0679949.1 hypothetical protein [Neoroseomonas eburnea]
MTESPHGLPGHAKVLILRGMARHWWAFVLRGAAAILFGVLAFVFPGLGLVTLLAFLAAWLAVEGVATIWVAVAGKGEHGVWTWIDGLLSLAAAAILLFMPGLSAVMLVLIAGFWGVAVGVARLVLAFRAADVLLGLLGAVTVLFGAWLLARPGPGLIALVWLVALEAVAMGVILVALGFRLKRLSTEGAATPR